MTPDPRNAKPVQLHVIHDLGGGSAKWVVDYCEADTTRTNLVLRSFTHDDAAASGIALYASATDEVPVRLWKFSRRIPAAVVSHAEYRAALDEILAAYRVEALLVSSLIGHSLEALDTGLPTVVVNHDYFPYCASVNLYLADRCSDCAAKQLAQCPHENAAFTPFADFPPAERAAVRDRFIDLVRRPNVVMAVPSRSLAENLIALDARFNEAAFVTIPHGYGRPLKRLPTAEPGPERLRVVVLGQLSVPKGAQMLTEALPHITQFADIHLLGCRELGESFRFMPHVHVFSYYEIADLPVHVANINPHIGLLTSIVPETFNYALTELMMLGVPAAATRLGSFVERIQPGVNGYLYEPDARSLLATLKAIDRDRGTLSRVRAGLRGWLPRPVEEMVADYHRITPVGRGAASLRAAAPAPTSVDGAAAGEAITIASMWKEVKRLHLQLTIVGEARHRTETQRQALERQVADYARTVARKEAELVEKERQVQHVASQLHLRNTQLAELHASTSWRLSRPIRWAGRMARRLRILGRAARAALRDPASLPGTVRSLSRAWRAGGLLEVKRTLVALQPNEGYRDAWLDYRNEFRRSVRPRIVERIRAMGAKPLVSVIVPTYETPEPMLREMIDSVRRQLYPEWELCIADDGSRQPHVARILREYAAAEPRIKLHLGDVNRGVSHASNRALELATGAITVLLDHDDLLEEQALFRVAECVVEDAPDFLYSDEVLVNADATAVLRYAYRPAFSPEYLRSHPYIVHLVGVRTELLRAVGGFDETLRISQDYDLILRVAEKSARIVHIPEILYQWRLHGGSSGTEKKGEVMRTSKDVIARHLQRVRLAGEVGDGSSFNLFDVRYPLGEGLKVAIIIPTKDHGELVRQCIESLRSTIVDVSYDIVVVDHESTDPATISYLLSLAPEVRVVRYEGPFNFSAINNHAVAQLDGRYTHYLFCNNDIEAIQPGWLERMMELCQQPGIGIVGAKLFYPDRKSIQHAGVCVGAYGAAEHYAKRLRYPEDPVEPGFAELLIVNHEVAAVTAACLLIRKEAFARIDGFDESIAVGFGDVDLCLRVGELGCRVIFCPFAELVHHESYTRGTSTHDPHPEDSALYRLKWKALLAAGDPFHNPGLSLTSSNWSLKRPLTCGFEIARRIVSPSEDGGQAVAFGGGRPPIRLN